MIAIHDLPHVLAVINAATIVVLLYAYSRIRARDREGHRRTMMVAIGLGVAFLGGLSRLSRLGGPGEIRRLWARSGRSTSRCSPFTS